MALLTSYLRPSTLNQYQSVWSSWLSFVRDKRLHLITADFLISYLRFLFTQRHFSPNTIKTYKAALREPLLLAFNLDLQDDVFLKAVRSFSLLRPARPPGKLSWSLSNVLSPLADLDHNSCSLRDLLDKLIFLIALASGGRVSEISALRRGPDFTYVTPSGHLSLQPGPDFLAKTEDPQQRRKPWRISPLPGDDTSLCPVATLQSYLDRTSDYSFGSLFRHHVSGKPLTVSAVRCRITSIIKRYNPGSIPKTHDLRKMASSLAFFEGMSFPDISHMTGWTSPFVFMRHYLHEIEALVRSCVVLGRSLRPTNTAQDQ